MLEENIKSLQKKSQSFKSASVQTDNVDGMLCIECEYPAEDLFDLGEHMHEVHTETNGNIMSLVIIVHNYSKQKEMLCSIAKSLIKRKSSLVGTF